MHTKLSISKMTRTEVYIITQPYLRTFANNNIPGNMHQVVTSNEQWSSLSWQLFDLQHRLLHGSQFGYNQCNATTEGPGSNCQTAMIDSVSEITCLIRLVHSVIQTFVNGPLQSQAWLLLARRVRSLTPAMSSLHSITPALDAKMILHISTTTPDPCLFLHI